MTLEELWELFPIILKEHNPDYKNWYNEEKEKILLCVKKENIKRINHIGSSAVKGLISKPTVDILLEIKNDYNIDILKDILIKNGWGLMFEEKENLNMVFNKGYTKYGFEEKVYHLHVRYLGDWNELYFRDYLIENSDIAKLYGELKLELQPKYEHNRDGYTDAKSEFILKYTKLAKKKYSNKYKPL
jgi:GrpB-like predicted nucleotidyltransferase (UPF0157 family)